MHSTAFMLSDHINCTNSPVISS